MTDTETLTLFYTMIIEAVKVGIFIGMFVGVFGIIFRRRKVLIGS